MKSKRDTPQVGAAEIGEIIRKTFADFDVFVEIVEAKDGLRAHHFTFRTVKPVRMRAIHSFVDDLRYALACSSLEILAPIPGKQLIGITIPKADEPRSLVRWSEAINNPEYTEAEPLVVPLGREEFGQDHFIDIARLPHLLIGGTTGSGKTTILHSLILSLVHKNSPDVVRLLLIDPKSSELHAFGALPHILTPAITDAKKAILSLKWAAQEMERRFDILETYQLIGVSCTDIGEYHAKILGNKKLAKDSPNMPYIVIVIDELADIMQMYPLEMEVALVRLAQKSRAVGIHLIVTTQRPETKVVTGLIKANMPARIAYKVNSRIDSRAIIDRQGAENLVGMGDMLYMDTDTENGPLRVQSFYVSEEEVRQHCARISRQYGMTDPHAIPSPFVQNTVFEIFQSDDEDSSDELYEQAKEIVINDRRASISHIQRCLHIGYSRAARLIDLLEEHGVIGPADGAKPREIFE